MTLFTTRDRSGHDVNVCYPANLSPLGLDVLNEVRRLADDSLSHHNRPERKTDVEWAASVAQNAIGPAEFDQFRTKKRMTALSTGFEADILEHWPVYLLLSVAI